MQSLFQIPQSIEDYLITLDGFIDEQIKPLEDQDDNLRFFDHRRENSRTDWDAGGLPAEDWEALLSVARDRADAA
jgi:acyl-CoA dehydrogenase